MIKALTLWQPWATLIAIGAKRIETRSWHTFHYEGRPWLAIHAAGGTANPAWRVREAFQNPVIAAALADYGITESNWTGGPASLPQGAVVAVARLVGCGPVAQCTDISENERAMGNYDPGRWAWYLDDIRKLPHPVLCKGKQGLWTLDLHTLTAVEAELDRYLDSRTQESYLPADGLTGLGRNV